MLDSPLPITLLKFSIDIVDGDIQTLQELPNKSDGIIEEPINQSRQLVRSICKA